MKFKIFALIFIFSALPLLSQNNKIAEQNHKTVQEDLKHDDESFYGKTEEEYEGEFQAQRAENFWKPRFSGQFQVPTVIELMNSIKSFNSPHSEKQNPSLQASEWSAVGPFDEPDGMGPNNKGIGRINVVRLEPSNTSHIWIGSANGGAWYSNDGGNSWSTFDFTQFLSMGVADIAISSQNPDVVYVATGDADGVSGNQNYYSIGVIKTTNGGKDWSVTGFSNSLIDGNIIGRLIVDPRNDNVLVAATKNGVEKSVDGGATWEIKQGGEYFRDIEISPANPDILYASTFTYSGNTRIFKSTDFGSTWKVVYSASGAIRIALAVTPANPAVGYALLANQQFGFHSLLMTSDTGNTWKQVVSSASLKRNLLAWGSGNLNSNPSDVAGQGQYDLALAVSPNDANIVIVGGINIWASVDGGKSWDMSAHWQGALAPYVHADIHDLVFSPDGASLIASSDGGLALTVDFVNWTSLAKGINITQYYRIDAAGESDEIVYGGAQDNGSMQYNNGTWRDVGGGDGMDCAIDHKNTNIAFISSQNGYFLRTSNGKDFGFSISNNITGENGGWTAPIAIDPTNTDYVYVGYQNVWRSIQSGKSGSYAKVSDFGQNQTLNYLAVAPSNGNYVYAGFSYMLYESTDRGLSWNKIYQSNTQITSFAVDPYNPTRLWITKSGFADDDKVYEYNDGKIINVSGNLPNVPMNTVAIDRIPNGKDTVDRLYVGSDIGVFYSDYGSAYWQKYGTGLPNLIVSDLNINQSKRMLYAATFGRGVWKAGLLECNETGLAIVRDGDSVLCPGQTTTISLAGNHPGVQWTNGASGSSITVSEPGTYSAFYSENGCVVRSNGIRITKYPLDTIIITPGGSGYICEDATITLAATNGFNKYIWSNGDSVRVITVNAPGKYTVTGMSPYGCTVNSAEFDLVQKPKPDKPVIDKHGDVLYAPDAKSYQWYRDGKIILGATKQTYQFTEAQFGNYEVKITDEFGCSNTSDPLNVTTGVWDDAKNLFSLYPNPSDGLFNMKIFMNSDFEMKFEIFDVFGNSVLTIKQNLQQGSHIIPLDLTGKPAGVYMLQMEINGSVQIQKLIKN